MQLSLTLAGLRWSSRGEKSGADRRARMFRLFRFPVRSMTALRMRPQLTAMSCFPVLIAR